ncbi:unnamed protein product [Brassica oleracea var. botrytis]|uniref:BnaC07g12190D protein n=3 Tax=Brassica TaxID=3705 RepID=A0A078G6G3_BRANA|nr:BnaC07g12190D [Brassica napus]VDD36868.1 unnamed protein product [Brassica oleracea]
MILCVFPNERNWRRFVVSSNEESSSTQASTIVDIIFNDFPFTAFITILSYKKIDHCTSTVEVRLLRF